MDGITKDYLYILLDDMNSMGGVQYTGSKVMKNLSKFVALKCSNLAK